MRDQESIGWRTLYNYLSQVTVGLVGGQPEDKPSWNGSGVLVRTPGGKVACITAQHVAVKFRDTECRMVKMGWRDALPNCCKAIIPHPEKERDIAILAIKEWPSEDPVYSLADLVDDSFGDEEDPAIICGAVAACTRRMGRWHYRLGFISYQTGRRPGISRGEWDWGESALDMFTDARHDLPDPGGLSGCGIWHTRPIGPEGVWAPSKVAQLGGIQHTWRSADRLVLGEPIEGVVDWLEGGLREIDEL